MQIITPQTLAAEAAKAWAEQYSEKPYYVGSDKVAIYESLLALGDNPTPEQVNAAIGNKSWTTPPTCSECGDSEADTVVQVGEEPDYESDTAYLCLACVEKLWELVGQARGTASRTVAIGEVEYEYYASEISFKCKCGEQHLLGEGGNSVTCACGKVYRQSHVLEVL